jgi:hypothetical protein
VKISETDRLYDNTRLSDYDRCPRYYYYRHHKGWSIDAPPGKALAFGASWHEGMDVIWQSLLKDDATKEYSVEDRSVEKVALDAQAAFQRMWTDEWGFDPAPDPDDKRDFRHAMTAAEMYYEYIDKRSDLFMRSDIFLIEVEKTFVVPLDPTDASLFYVGRMDKVFRLGDQVLIGEHKTTSAYDAKRKFRPGFIESFSPNSQVDGYIYAGNILWPGDFTGVWVDASLVHKTVHDGHQFIPIQRTREQIESWLWETRAKIADLERDRKVTDSDLAKEATYLPAYRKNPGRCWDFASSCPYLECCKMWGNPERQEKPVGYKEDFWSPHARLKLG